MEQHLTKGLAVGVTAMLTVYFSNLFLPLIILICVMIGDYASGMINAWMTRTISSRVGIIGIIKKLCYLLVVSVGIACDIIGNYALCDIGITFLDGKYIFAIVVIIWLIVNELISILENLAEIGIPVPTFLLTVVSRLKNSVDAVAKDIKDKDKEE